MRYATKIIFQFELVVPEFSAFKQMWSVKQTNNELINKQTNIFLLLNKV